MIHPTTIDDRDVRDGTPVSRPSRYPGPIAAGLVALLVLIGFSSMIRPSPAGLDAPLSEFSSARAMAHVERIAFEPHPMGSAAIDRVRDYLSEQLVDMGLEPETQVSRVPDYYGAPGTMVDVVNVMARIQGVDSASAIALVAHYDTHPATAGANDNSAAVAVLLEAGRALLAGPQPETDIVLLFTDAEEPQPRYGAVAFAEHRWFDDIAMAVNLEAIGSTGPSLPAETSSPETGIVNGFISSSDRPVVFSFLPETVGLFGGVGTDFDVFKDAGVPGLSFAYVRGSTIYHTDRDSIETVSQASVQHHGENVLAAVAAFVDGTALAGGADEVYFSIGPFFVVSYSSIWAVVLAGALAAAFVAMMLFELSRQRVELRAVGRGSLVLLAGSLAACLAAYATWWLFTAVRSTMGVWESYGYLMVLLALVALVLSLAGGAVAGRYSDSELAGGIVSVWVLLALATALTVPGFSYLFLWPALGAVIALASTSSGRFGNWLWLVVAVPAVILTIPALDVFYQMAQPRPGNVDSQLLETVVVVAFVAALVIGLIVPFLPRRLTSH